METYGNSQNVSACCKTKIAVTKNNEFIEDWRRKKL